jgi:hypothetical protein
VLITVKLIAQSSDRLTPVTLGDAIIEPLFDSEIRNLKTWKMEGENLNVEDKFWTSVPFSYSSIKTNKAPLFSKEYQGEGIYLSDYNTLVVSMGVSKGTSIKIKAITDKGEFENTVISQNSTNDQYLLAIPAAKYLKKIEISLEAEKSGKESGYLVWIGVRNPGLMALEQQNWELFNEQPLDLYVREKPMPIDARPIHYLLFSEEAYDKAIKLRKSNGQLKQLHAISNLVIGPYDGSVNNIWFGRTIIYNKGAMLLNGSKVNLMQVLIQAALNQDTVSLREAAKTAVKYALIPNWDVDFVTNYPGGIWEQRCFTQAKIAYELAMACDLAGCYLTSAGEALILRRLAESGLGNINFNAWKYPYIYRNNQLPVFSVGRIASYVLLESFGAGKDNDRIQNKSNTNWSHIQPYTDQAFSEFNESLSNIFLPDGGFKEGSAYLAYTLENAFPTLALYARARQLLSYNDLLSKEFKYLDNYLEVLRSTAPYKQFPSDEMVHVQDGQGGPVVVFGSSVLSFLAKLKPNGAAARLLAAQALKNKDIDLSIEPWALPMPDLSAVNPDSFETFTELPETGYTASTRRSGVKWNKMIVMGGNKASISHNHQDRGSFILEYGGEAFAVDPGGLLYADVASSNMKLARNHNMLVPVIDNRSIPAPDNSLNNVIPMAKGNEKKFDASFSPGVLWPDYYNYWNRSILSPDPQSYTIIDNYSLKNGIGVDFIWQTPLPVLVKGQEVKIQGKFSTAVITTPKGCKIEVLPSRKLGMRDLSTIYFHSNKKAGELLTRVRFLDLK